MAKQGHRVMLVLLVLLAVLDPRVQPAPQERPGHQDLWGQLVLPGQQVLLELLVDQDLRGRQACLDLQDLPVFPVALERLDQRVQLETPDHQDHKVWPDLLDHKE